MWHDIAGVTGRVLLRVVHGGGEEMSTVELVQIALLIVVTALLISLILTLAVCYIRYDINHIRLVSLFAFF